jgi:V/A-type H+-transporting ATPase subunit A
MVLHGDTVTGGNTLGTVPEGPITHKITVPFDMDRATTVTWIRDGAVTVDDPVARLRDETGAERTVTLRQDWPVRSPLPPRMLARGVSRRLYPAPPMVTS